MSEIRSMLAFFNRFRDIRQTQAEPDHNKQTVSEPDPFWDGAAPEALKAFGGPSRPLPESANELQRLAWIYLQLGQILRAKDCYAALAEQRGGPDRVKRGFARVAQQLDQWEEAASRWNDILAERPDDSQAALQHAQARAKLGDLEPLAAFYGQRAAQGDAKPHDRVMSLRIRSRMEWIPFNADVTARLVEEFPGDMDVALAHAAELRRNSDNISAARFIEVMRSRFAHEGQRMLIESARHYAFQADHQAAADCFMKALEARPKELHLVASAARSLAQAGEIETALEMLHARSAGQDVLPYILAEIDIRADSGELNAAIRSAIRAVRICPSVAVIFRLYVLLMDKQWFRFAQRPAESIVRDFPECAPVWSRRVRIEDDRKSWENVVAFAERSLATQQNFGLVRPLANALYQMGDVRRAFRCGVATASFDMRHLSRDRAKCDAARQALEAHIEAISRQLPEDTGAVLDDLLTVALRTAVPKSNAAKFYREPSDETANMLKSLHDAESRADMVEAKRLIDEGLDAALMEISEPLIAGDLCLRASRIAEAADARTEALSHIETAVYLSKNDTYLVKACRDLMRRQYESVRIGSEDRIPVLLVSCQPNLKRARAIADRIRKVSGRVVILVWAEDDANGYAMSATPFGHELIVPCSDRYIGLPRKMLLAYRFLDACTDCAGVLKLDDDIHVYDGARFEALIRRCSEAPTGYAGQVGNGDLNIIYHHGRATSQQDRKHKAAHDIVPYCLGGDGYYLSRKALNAIFRIGLRDYGSDHRPAIYEDVLIGEILARAGIKPTEIFMSKTGGYAIDVYEPFRFLRGGALK